MRLLDLFGMAALAPQGNEATNGGAVTILLALTNVVLSTALDFAVGDYVLLRGHVRCTKGATGGRTVVQAAQDSGGAVFAWLAGASDVYEASQDPHAAGAVFDPFVTELARCIASGSAVFAMRGSSAGSNSTVGIGRAAIAVRRLRA